MSTASSDRVHWRITPPCGQSIVLRRKPDQTLEMQPRRLRGIPDLRSKAHGLLGYYVKDTRPSKVSRPSFIRESSAA